MQRNLLTPKRTGRRAGGFTLLELLIAITIIAILAALITPAVANARRAAQIAQCRTEIAGLEAALNEFKTKYGDYPPSRITLYSSSAAWANTSDAEVRRSRAIISRFWPRFNFGASSFPVSATVELRGAECLVFFLGGMRRAGGAANDLIGFANDPANPFNQSATSRTAPFFEFNPARLQTGFTAGGYDFQVYLDPLPSQDHPYLYASSNDGSGFEAADVQTFTPAPGVTLNHPNRMTTEAYRQATNGSFWKNRSVQIISPGFDHEFGTGGVWNENTADSDLAGTRSVERDNITNFHNSTLAPF